MRGNIVSNRSRTNKVIGIVVAVVGAVMILAGGLTWNLTSTQLKAQDITVSTITDDNPGWLANKPVAGPFTAYAQATAIDAHTLEGNKGRTYAQIGDDAKVLKAKLAKQGLDKAEIATHKDVVALSDGRDQAAKGSFLMAALYTSVIAFGIAALVMALGVLFVLLGVVEARRV